MNATGRGASPHAEPASGPDAQSGANPLHEQSSIEREIRATLIRHLPIGLEGVGAAQTRAILDVLRRRTVHPYRTLVDTDARSGMRLLRAAALRHRDSVLRHPDGARTCGICREGDRLAAWPCPVWSAAVLLRLVHESPTAAGG